MPKQTIVPKRTIIEILEDAYRELEVFTDDELRAVLDTTFNYDDLTNYAHFMQTALKELINPRWPRPVLPRPLERTFPVDLLRISAALHSRRPIIPPPLSRIEPHNSFRRL
jgi:hypothetical protein